MHERLPLIGEPFLQALSVKLYVPMNEHRVIGRQDRTDLVGGHLETPERVSRPAHALPVEAGSHPFGHGAPGSACSWRAARPAGQERMALFWGHLPSHGRTSLVCTSAHVGPGSESGLIAQAQIFMAA